MRILSQDGAIDVPYEMVGINIWKKSCEDGYAFFIYAHSNSLNMKQGIFARYSSQEKAEKAMKMLQSTYYESELSKISNDNTSFLTTHFQFPKDAEIEV